MLWIYFSISLFVGAMFGILLLQMLYNHSKIIFLLHTLTVCILYILYNQNEISGQLCLCIITGYIIGHSIGLVMSGLLNVSRRSNSIQYK
jgi:putative effector of murein hydrolase